MEGPRLTSSPPAGPEYEYESVFSEEVQLPHLRRIELFMMGKLIANAPEATCRFFLNCAPELRRLHLLFGPFQDNAPELQWSYLDLFLSLCVPAGSDVRELMVDCTEAKAAESWPIHLQIPPTDKLPIRATHLEDVALVNKWIENRGSDRFDQQFFGHLFEACTRINSFFIWGITPKGAERLKLNAPLLRHICARNSTLLNIVQLNCPRLQFIDVCLSPAMQTDFATSLIGCNHLKKMRVTTCDLESVNRMTIGEEFTVPCHLKELQFSTVRFIRPVKKRS